MRTTLPTSSRNCRGSRPRAAAHQRPSGRTHPTRTDPSTIPSPTTKSRTQICPGIHAARRHTTEHNHSPPQHLTDAPAQISGSGAQSCLKPGFAVRRPSSEGPGSRNLHGQRTALDGHPAAQLPVRPSRYLVTAPSHRPGDLLLKATRGVTIAIISSLERKRRQPGLATDGPAFVGWHQLVRSIQGSYVHFDFVCAACENGGAAAGTEKPPGVVACFAIDRHRILREHRGSVKKGAMMLAAVETVTNADPIWKSRRHNSDVAAQTTAGESVHAASPPKSSGREWIPVDSGPPARHRLREDAVRRAATARPDCPQDP
jgi:hypothetical protein